MSAPRIAVVFAAAFFATTASFWPQNTKSVEPQAEELADPGTPFGAPPAQARADVAWPPPGVRVLGAAGASAPAPSERETPAALGVEARLSRAANGGHRLVVDSPSSFVHLRYREVASAGPDWAAIELQAGDKAPSGDVAVWESTDPKTLETRRGLVRFSLSGGAPELVLAEAPRPGPRQVTKVHDCRAHEDGSSGFAVVCRVEDQARGVRAIRPMAQKPLAGAWVWDLPRRGGRAAGRLVRFDLPLSAGSADVGALGYVHGGKGVVVRADAMWASAEEAPSLLLTETSRIQPAPFWF